MRGVLPVVAVCAAAGIITATTTKTGLGAQLASLLVSGAQAVTDNPTAVLALTVVLAAIALAHPRPGRAGHAPASSSAG